MSKTIFRCGGFDCAVDFDEMKVWALPHSINTYHIRKDPTNGWQVQDPMWGCWEPVVPEFADQIELLYNQHVFLSGPSIKSTTVDKICFHPNKYELTLFTSKSWHCPDCDKEVT